MTTPHVFSFVPNKSPSVSIDALPLLLICTLFFIYSPSFTLDYLMNDELTEIGKRMDPLQKMDGHFHAFGRGLSGYFYGLTYNFVGYDTVRIQWIRFLSFVSLATIAVLLYRAAVGALESRVMALFAVLFFYCQPAIQGLMAYSLQLISSTLPGIWLSLAAFYLHFSTGDVSAGVRWRRRILVILVFVIAGQFSQVYAYFCFIPLILLSLAEWKSRSRQIIEFILLASVALIITLAIYHAALSALHLQGAKGYDLGEQAVDALNNTPLLILLKALDLSGYWSAFQLWSYPFPWHDTVLNRADRMILAYGVLTAWITLMFAALIVEVKSIEIAAVRQLLAKWFVLLVIVGVGALWMVADSPIEVVEHRPHVTIVLTGIVIFSAAFALRRIAVRFSVFRSPFVVVPMMMLMLAMVFGAQSGFLKGYVGNRADQLAFIRTELLAKPPPSYNRVVVLQSKGNFCTAPPCGRWSGSALHGTWHESRKGRYRYVLATLGAMPETKTIEFTHKPPKHLGRQSVMVNWNKYLFAAKRYREAKEKNL